MKRVTVNAVILATLVGMFGTHSEARAQAVPGACHDSSRACSIAAADAYLQSLVTHDARAVPFAPDVKRRENASDTGNGADYLRNQLQTNPAYGAVLGIRDKRWFVDGNQVIGYYLIDTGIGVPFITTHVAERFKIVEGSIYEIEAIFVANLGAGQGNGF